MRCFCKSRGADLMKAAFVIALLLVASAAYPVKEIEDAAGHNAEIAPELLDLSNHCSFPERQPTEGDIFSAVGIAAVSIIPQADNATSDRAGPELLWSLSAQYPQAAVFDSHSGCSGHRLEISSPRLQFD